MAVKKPRTRWLLAIVLLLLLGILIEFMTGHFHLF